MTVHRTRAVSAFILSAVACAISSFAPPALAEGAIRVEVIPLQNDSALSDLEMKVLDGAVLSALCSLPRERFEVVPLGPGLEGACDDSCQIQEGAARGATYLVKGEVTAFGEGTVCTLKLLDVAAGRLAVSATTEIASNAGDVLRELTEAAEQIREAIDPPPQPAPGGGSPVPPPDAAPAQAGRLPSTGEALVLFESEPPGATVAITRRSTIIHTGVTPFEIQILPAQYRLTARLPEHKMEVTKVYFFANEKRIVRFRLQRVYPVSPYKLWGLGGLFLGAVVTAGSFGAMVRAKEEDSAYQHDLSRAHRDNARAWTGAMWGGFGVGAALVVTGIVLLAAGPNGKELYEREHGAAVAPTADGGLQITYGRRF